MPCSKPECDHLLLVSHKHQDLRCPHCLDVPIVEHDNLSEEIEHARQLMSDERLAIVLKEYSKDHLLLYLIERLNRISHNFYETRALNSRDFSYLNYLIKIIYPEEREDFGDEYLERGDQLDDSIDELLDRQARVVNALNHIEEGFRFCVKYPISMRKSRSFLGDYGLYDSEYRYCNWRCRRSLTGGRPEDQALFDKNEEEVRDFDTPDGGDIDTLYDFANTFFEFINGLLFIASADDVIGDIYTTFPPDHVSVFDIKELLDEIDQQFTDEGGYFLLQDSTLGGTNKEGLNEAGTSVFGDDWNDVKESIVVSEDNLSAHPFLFEVQVEEVIKRPPGRPPITKEEILILYPRHYARLLRYQIFPLLKNGDQDSGHEILSKVAESRGLEFERKLYDYLTDQGLKSYHSAELPGIDSSEIDLLVINENDEELWFTECKYLLPETDMNTAQGIETLNAKFDHKVFNEGADVYEGTPAGKPFPEKVEQWRDLRPGSRFKWQKDPQSPKVNETFQESWDDLEPRSLVVSNLTPSYIQKRGVEFRTDLELVEMIDEEDSVYTIKT